MVRSSSTCRRAQSAFHMSLPSRGSVARPFSFQQTIMFCFFIATFAHASTSFHVSNVFGSHMVLQRDRPIVINGFSAAVGDSIVATAHGGVEGVFGPAVVDTTGVWRLSIPPQPTNTLVRFFFFFFLSLSSWEIFSQVVWFSPLFFSAHNALVCICGWQ